VGVGERELDDVVGQGLVLVVYAETVVVHLVVLLRVPEAQRVEPLRDLEVFTQGLLARDYREGPSRAYLHHQQFVLQLLPRRDAFDLSHIENHAVLAGHVAEFEALLTDPFDSVGASE
jgi:hypothetical protein